MSRPRSIYILVALAIIPGLLLTSCEPTTSIGQDGRIYTLYENGSPKKAYELNNQGDPTGWVTEWHANGQRKMDYFLDEKGLKNGEFTEWDEKGRIIRTGNYFQGEKEGDWQSFLYVMDDSPSFQRHCNDTTFFKGNPTTSTFLVWHDRTVEDYPSISINNVTDLSGTSESGYYVGWRKDGTPFKNSFYEAYSEFGYLRTYKKNGSVLEDRSYVDFGRGGNSFSFDEINRN